MYYSVTCFNCDWRYRFTRVNNFCLLELISRRRRSTPLGGRNRQISLYNVTPHIVSTLSSHFRVVFVAQQPQWINLKQTDMTLANPLKAMVYKAEQKYEPLLITFTKFNPQIILLGFISLFWKKTRKKT